MDYLLLFVPSDYDDYGWTPEEFRVLARIHRRCLGKGGSVGQFYESIPNMAKTIHMSAALVRRSLNVLEAAGAITRENRTGATAIIRFEAPCNWVPSSELPAIRQRYTPAKNERGKTVKSAKKAVEVVPKSTPPGTENERGVVPKSTPSVVAKTKGGVVPKSIDKGIPLKGIPLKGIPLREIPSGAQNSDETSRALSKKKNKAINALEGFFKIKLKEAEALEIEKNVDDLEEWYQLLADKEAYQDQPNAIRSQIPIWIVPAYLERIEAKRKVGG